MKDRWKFVSQIANYSFYIALFVEVLIVLIDKSSYTNPIEGKLFQITFALFLTKVCLTRYTAREYLTIILFLILGAVSYFATGRNEIVRFVMFIAACKNINMQQCLKRVFWMTLSGCLIIMLMAITGIYGTISLTQDYGRGMIETRYTFGLGHPNALQCMVWALTTLGLYLYGEKMRWYGYIGIAVINFGFFLYTDSKTGLLVSFGAIIAFLGVRYVKSNLGNRIMGWGAMMTYVLCIVLSVMVAKDAMCIWYLHVEGIYDPKVKFYLFLDKLLTGRIVSLVGTTNHEGTMQTWSLWSSIDNNYYFDMGWIRLFYWYGVIPALIIITVILIFMVRLYKSRKIDALVMIMIFSVYTVVEAHAVSVYLARNYIVFLIGGYWWQLLRQKEILLSD